MAYRARVHDLTRTPRTALRPQLRAIEGGWIPKGPLVAQWGIALDGALTCRWRPAAAR